MARVRLFRPYDLTFFLDKKKEIFCLNNRIRFTNNQLSVKNCLLDFFGLISSEITAVCYGPPNIYYWGGQAGINNKFSTAWINWLIAGEKADNSNLPLLLDFLIKEAGNEQMKSLAVVLDENHWFSTAFRQNGFSIFSKQTVWHISSPAASCLEEWTIVSVNPFDEYDMFYQSQIPPLIRQLGSNWEKDQIYTLRKENQVTAFAKVEVVRNQVYIDPVFHPAVDNPGRLLIKLAASVCEFPEPDIWVCVPGFQAWMTDSLISEGFQIENRQTVFVKNLTAKVTETTPLFAFDQKSLQPIGTHQLNSIRKVK